MNVHIKRLVGTPVSPVLLAFSLQSATHHAPTVFDQSTRAAIPVDQIGMVAGKDYSGDGLTVSSTADGVQLRCIFQRLDADATTNGLWLVSTKVSATGEPFRLVARSLGRSVAKALAFSGRVEVAGRAARFLRPGLTEEYSERFDGVHQDFVIQQKPPGQGPVHLELEVDGARAEAMAGGARLTLDDGERSVVYNRLAAEDARGKQVTAKMDVLSSNRLAVILEDAGAEYPVRIDPTFSDANWFSLGEGMNNAIYSFAVSGTTLYAGGDFTVATNTGGAVVNANCIAQWNGSSWSALGLGFNGGVNALAVLGTNLYASGFFTAVTNTGGAAVTVNYVAQWNGSSWSALGSGMNSPVLALAVSGTNLYVGGMFGRDGDGIDSYNGIAQWNGSSWSALGSGVLQGDTGPHGDVFSLAVSGTDLYAGGMFIMAGTNTANYIARWNGGTWSALGSGIAAPGGPPDVYALAVSGGTLYAGGHFTSAGGIAATNIAQWNGSTWSPLGSGITAGDPNHTAAYVEGLMTSGVTLYVGGTFTTAGEISATNIAQWNGSTWSTLGPGMNGDVIALAVSGGTLYAGGSFTAVGTNDCSYLAGVDLTPPPPTLSAPRRLASGRFQMLLNGVAAQNYTLEMSTNLSTTNWVALYVTNNPATNSFPLTDPNATNSERFYRVRVGP